MSLARRLLAFAVLSVIRPLIGALSAWDDMAMDLSEDL